MHAPCPLPQVQQLLETGADVAARDKRGVGALHYAAGQGRLEVVKYLWSKGLDIDAEDPGVQPNRDLACVLYSWPVLWTVHGESQ